MEFIETKEIEDKIVNFYSVDGKGFKGIYGVAMRPSENNRTWVTDENGKTVDSTGYEGITVAGLLGLNC
jgi:hypothetical protein